ncbi:hypothetical protein [Streptomyces sp. WP-1]|nr:hypothetical protein [Streptomyces sp. WP-1]WKE68349.1 hypothetical protein QHG49_04555 [Streptomyces sp. WP-1]
MRGGRTFRVQETSEGCLVIADSGCWTESSPTAFARPGPVSVRHPGRG